MPTLTREEECHRIIAAYGEHHFDQIMGMLERQFMVLHNRAQVLLALAGVVVTTTGFSGRLVAGTNRAAQVLIITGVSLALVSAALVVWGVLHLKWLTMHHGQTTETWIMSVLAYRDLKTGYYRVAIVLMLLGLAFYVAAIAIMLLYPNSDALQAR